MSRPPIAALRLYNQCLTQHTINSPDQLVAYMGALQAQDYDMAKWGIGSRLQGATESVVANAVDEGRLIRVHIMRPTWHLVAAADFHWLMQLTAPRLKQAYKTSDKQLGLTEDVLQKSYDCIVRQLQSGAQLTRPELADRLRDEWLDFNIRQITHVFYHAELDRMVCNGAMRKNKHTYALVSQRLAAPAPFDHDWALAQLARRYFSSHGPATLADFVWWSGLTATQAKQAVGMLSAELVQLTDDGLAYYCARSNYNPDLPHSPQAHLLPAFDEYLVSYKDRGHVLPAAHYRRVISSQNGTFKPFILYNYQVIGAWTKSIVKGKLTVDTDYFTPPTKAIEKAVAQAIDRYLAYKAL